MRTAEKPMQTMAIESRIFATKVLANQSQQCIPSGNDDVPHQHELQDWLFQMKVVTDSVETDARCIAAWDERYSVVEESCALSLAGSAEEEQAGSSLAVAKARSAKKAATRSAPSGIAAPPPKRQCFAEVQATTLAHVEGCAGRLAALEVSGVTPCSSSPAMLGIPAASRKSSSPALHEARTLLGGRCRHQSHTSPCQASSRSPTKKRCAESRKTCYLQSVL